MTHDVGIFICPVCEAVIEGDKPCPRRGLKQHGDPSVTNKTDVDVAMALYETGNAWLVVSRTPSEER